METSLPEFAPFDAENRENIEIRRQRWFVRFENLLVALDIKDKHRRTRRGAGGARAPPSLVRNIN